jgi:hypothetical protein
MLEFIDDLICQLFHGKWAEVVSYSRQGAWKCTKPGCASQARHDRASAGSRRPVPARNTSFEALPVQRRRKGQKRAHPAA